jgi:hypothetical protein
MISHFFIDRPIFAAVLSIVITLTGGIALVSLPIAQYPPVTPPAVSVTIAYPGASAQVVADTVAAPIEQQVNGVEGMLYMSSQMGNDGSYTLAVTFDIGTDLDTALVMVQNRVQLAEPLLPISVQNQGITIRKKTPDILNLINFYSPDGRYDDVYLSNFAQINVYDELLRIEGVSQINFVGVGNYSMRAWLDPQKLASLHLTANDVVNALQTQNLDVPAGVLGQQPAPPISAFERPVNTLGRLTTTEQFGELIVKAARVQPASRVNVPVTTMSGNNGPTSAGAKWDDRQPKWDNRRVNGGNSRDVPRFRQSDRLDDHRRREHDLARRQQQRDGQQHHEGRRPKRRRSPERRRRHKHRCDRRLHERRWLKQRGEWPVEQRRDVGLRRQRRVQRRPSRQSAVAAGRGGRPPSRRGPPRTRGSDLQPRLHL